MNCERMEASRQVVDCDPVASLFSFWIAFIVFREKAADFFSNEI
jgi:hypothetical protein